jgi:hypothetical protein
MAVSKFHSYGLLNRWPVRMFERLWPFNQAMDGYEQNSPAFYIQPERDLLAEALRDAFNTATRYLGYHPRPVYGTQTVYFAGGDWQRQTLSLDVGHLQAFGSRSTTLVAADAAVTYSDADGDSTDETATLTIADAAAITTTDVQVFFRTTDGAPTAADERYALPLKSIVKVGSTITITLERAHCVKPSFWDLYPYTDGNLDNRRNADNSAPTNFVTALDVYTVTTSDTGAVTLLSKPTYGTTALTETAATGVITNSESAEFVVRIASGNTMPSIAPYAVRVNYYAGRALESGEMFSPLETAIIRLANTNTLVKNAMFSFVTRDMWAEDNQVLWSNGFIPPEYANPLGIKRGHLEAWTTFVTYADGVKGFAR